MSEDVIDENISVVPRAKANAIRIQTARDMVEELCTCHSFRDKPVNLIKCVRAATGLGLKESKMLVDGVRQKYKEDSL